MTDLTLRRGDSVEPGIASLVQLLKDVFGATPLGIALSLFQGKR